MKKKEVIVLALIIVALSTRFLFIVDGQSILPNFTALAAIEMICATHLDGLKKWILPIILFWVSDIILNNVYYAQYYEGFEVFGSMWSYGAVLVIGLLAYYLMKKVTWGRLALTSLVAAVVFFLVTNFGVWISPATPYTKDMAGLIESYAMGIPFFRNTLLGNLFFSFMLYGVYDYIASRVSHIDPVVSRSQA